MISSEKESLTKSGNHMYRSDFTRKATLLPTLFLLVISTITADSLGNFTDIEIIRVYDGDTFFAKLPEVHPLLGDEIGIRIRGIDAPELERSSCESEKQLAIQARDMVASILEGAQSVSLVDVERGKYFRIVATILVDGININQFLLEANLTVPYHGTGKKKDWCQ